MDTQQIETILQGDPCARGVFAGVFPCDRLPRSIKHLPSGYVWNTAPYDTDGHWVALFVDERGNGEFFDSFGLEPLQKSFIRFLNKHCTSWTFNETRLQGLTSHVCGQYCIFYLLHRCRGFSLETIVHMFGQCFEDNDVLVHDFVLHL